MCVDNFFQILTQSLSPQIMHPTVSPSFGAIDQSLIHQSPVCGISTSVLTSSHPHTSTASLTDPMSPPASSSLQSTTVSKVHSCINTQDWRNIVHVYNYINTYWECSCMYYYYWYLSYLRPQTTYLPFLCLLVKQLLLWSLTTVHSFHTEAL